MAVADSAAVVVAIEAPPAAALVLVEFVQSMEFAALLAEAVEGVGATSAGPT